mmetsp:Transcript_28021/g.32108  ORF Transcript_28021/g.32108 Transcript_28021/m.32108 type:complete len:106 (+) Transcript_28021:155-472(+)
MNKLEDKLKVMLRSGKIQSLPFSYEYFTVLLWEIKGTETQAKEKLHLMSNEISQKIKSDPIENPDFKLPYARVVYFWVFGDSIHEQFKVVNFELNRLYMKHKDYR